jgi:hypothetical protein
MAEKCEMLSFAERVLKMKQKLVEKMTSEYEDLTYLIPTSNIFEKNYSVRWDTVCMNKEGQLCQKKFRSSIFSC